jgi:hypothetical protein
VRPFSAPASAGHYFFFLSAPIRLGRSQQSGRRSRFSPMADENGQSPRQQWQARKFSLPLSVEGDASGCADPCQSLRKVVTLPRLGEPVRSSAEVLQFIAIFGRPSIQPLRRSRSDLLFSSTAQGSLVAASWVTSRSPRRLHPALRGGPLFSPSASAGSRAANRC